MRMPSMSRDCSLPRLLAGALASLALASPANAGRPLQTEDAGVLDSGACEIEGSTLRLGADDDDTTSNSLAFNCGLGYRSQVGLTAARVREGDTTVHGAVLGGKTWLWRSAGEDPAAVTLAWSIVAEREDGAWSHRSDYVNLVGSVPAAEGTVHLNLGHLRQRFRDRSVTTWNVAYEHGGFEAGGLTWTPMAELFGTDRERSWWNLALRLTLVPEKASIDFSYGRETGDAKQRLVTAGFKFAF